MVKKILILGLLAITLSQLARIDSETKNEIASQNKATQKVMVASSQLPKEVHKVEHRIQERRKVVSRGGEREITVIATGYVWTGNPTATGPYPKRSHTIAVDPTVIPLGSVVNIISEYEDIDVSGIHYCEDTGGKIVGYKIDIFFSSKKLAKDWGVRKVKLIIKEKE